MVRLCSSITTLRPPVALLSWVGAEPKSAAFGISHPASPIEFCRLLLVRSRILFGRHLFAPFETPERFHDSLPQNASSDLRFLLPDFNYSRGRKKGLPNPTVFIGKCP